MWFLNFILNQKGVPAFQAGTLAELPTAGYIGRIYISTDTFAFYRDNGTTWDLVGGPGSATITGTGTNGQVAYFTASGIIVSTANALFDGTNFSTVNDIVVNGTKIGKGGGGIITNQAWGINSLVANTTGYSNLSIGSSALKANTTGFFNIAIGNNALEFNQTSYANIAIGSMALNENQSGYYNIAIGRNALLKNSTAYTNIAIGDGALRQTTTGPSNVAIGNDALFTNIIGGSNTAIGVNAGSHVIGSSNIMIGINSGNDSSLNGNTNNSVFIGNASGPNSFGQTNQIVIGDQTTGNGSNTVTIGNTSILNNYFNGNVRASQFTIGSPTDVNRCFAASGNSDSIAVYLEEYGNTTASADLFFYKGRGSVSSKSNVNVLDSLGALSFGGYVNGSLSQSVDIRAMVSNVNVVNNISDADVVIYQTYNSTTFTENLRLFASSGALYVRKMLVGTSVDNGATLQVDGTAIFTSQVNAAAFEVANGQFYRAKRNGGGVSINILGFESGTDNLIQVFSSNWKLRNTGTGDAGNMLTVDDLGNLVVTNTIKTASPTGGTSATWKLGSYVAVAAPAPTGYIEIDIAGTLYKIAAGT